MARQRRRSSARAADLVQDSLLRALERGDSFRGEAAPGRWRRRILHHRFVDQLRATRETPYDDAALEAAVEAAWRHDDYQVDGGARQCRQGAAGVASRCCRPGWLTASEVGSTTTRHGLDPRVRLPVRRGAARRLGREHRSGYRRVRTDVRQEVTCGCSGSTPA
ncbi:MAG: hypothetical protein LCH98_12300 [Actinobacteria bacterium]|nr:hypothetical protein [Actinomycetota bacterium]